MKNFFITVWSKISNKGAIIGIVSGLLLILKKWGIEIPNESIMATVEYLCYIGVLVGIINNTGGETTSWNK